MPMIPTTNRGYTFAYIALAGLIILAFAAMWKNPNQWQYVLDWFGGKIVWLIPLVVGSKEVGKGIGNLTAGYKLKHENGVKPPKGGSE